MRDSSDGFGLGLRGLDGIFEIRNFFYHGDSGVVDVRYWLPGKRRNVGGKRKIRRGLFEALHAAGGEQGAHLGDGDVVEGGEALGLRQTLADEDGVQAFEVGEDDELFQRSVVAEVSFGGGIGIAPLFGGLAEEGDVEQVRLAGIDGGGLRLGKGLEFDTFKRWIVNLFPDADEFEGVAVAHPVVDQHIIPEFFRHVGQRDVVARIV